MLAMNELCTQLHRVSRDRVVREGAAAEAIARLQDDHVMPLPIEGPRGADSRCACADDKDACHVLPRTLTSGV